MIKPLLCLYGTNVMKEREREIIVYYSQLKLPHYFTPIFFVKKKKKNKHVCNFFGTFSKTLRHFVAALFTVNYISVSWQKTTMHGHVVSRSVVCHEDAPVMLHTVARVVCAARERASSKMHGRVLFDRYERIQRVQQPCREGTFSAFNSIVRYIRLR